MALSAKVGSFAINTGTGNQSVTGVGFLPKAIIFFNDKKTADGYGVNKSLNIGMATSSSARGATGLFFGDASFSQGIYADNTECILDTALGIIDGSADFVSFDADGFTVNVTDAPPSAWIINYLALGGADLTNAHVDSVTLSTSSGNQSFTGLGFQPDCVLFLTPGLAGTFPLTSSTISHLGFGFARSSSARAAVGIHDNNTNPTQSEAMLFSNRCIVGSASAAINHEIDLTSFDSDGFTLNVVDPPSAAIKVFYLALKGGQYKVGTETQKTSTGTKATTGVGFTPKALLLTGVNAVSSASLQVDNDRFSIGVSDGTTEGAMWAQSTDALSTADTNQRLIRTKAFTHSTNAATTNAEADMTAFGGDGFTLDWTTADATAREFAYLAIGDAAVVGGGGGSPNMLLLGCG